MRGHSELSVGYEMAALSVTFRFWGSMLAVGLKSHVMNSDSNETIATTHHSTLRLDNIQERQQSQQAAQYNSTRPLGASKHHITSESFNMLRGEVT